MKENQTATPNTLVHYRLLREMGRGALSPVWEAVDARSGCRVAIKTLVLPHTLETGERAVLAARMQREARVVARLSHPNIVTIFKVGRENRQPYLVMEYIQARRCGSGSGRVRSHSPRPRASWIR